jgi:uncharacterized protein
MTKSMKANMVRIPVEKEKIAAFCRKNYVRRLSFFGSVVRDDFSSGSDVDVLVEFEPGHTPGLSFFAMEMELSEIVGVHVDLNTPQFIGRYYRSQVEDEAVVQYEQAG